MCKEMMGQRHAIEQELKKELERATENIRKKGVYDKPSVRVDLEHLFIANRQYFEQQGFTFEPNIQVENGQVKYYAWIKLGGEGELGKTFWKKIREAREDCIKAQRKVIYEKLRDSGSGKIWVDMTKLFFENKLFFEERGYWFEPDSKIQNGEVMCRACMRKN